MLEEKEEEKQENKNGGQKLQLYQDDLYRNKFYFRIHLDLYKFTLINKRQILVIEKIINLKEISEDSIEKNILYNVQFLDSNMNFGFLVEYDKD